MINDIEILIDSESSILQCREAAMTMANKLGFRILDQVRITTAVSEIVRNVIIYAKSGKMKASSSGNGIVVVIEDNGPGIPDLERALQAGFSTKKGMGLGLSGSRRLMDEFNIQSTPDGTRVEMKKWLLADGKS